MRIGINASFLRKPATGIGQVTLNFLRKLIELQVQNGKLREHEIFLYMEEDYVLHLPENFHKRIFLPLWRRDDILRKIFWEGRLLSHMAQKDKCDVFLSLYQSTSVFPRNVFHVMLVHDIIPHFFPEYLNNLRKRIYQKKIERGVVVADRILAVSKHTEKDLIRHFDISPEKISVNYIDVDPLFKKTVSHDVSARVLTKYHLSPGYIYAGGGLEKRKNIEGVLRAYAYLISNFHFPISNQFPKQKIQIPKLVISGRLLPKLAPLVTDVSKLVRKLNLTPHVKVLDFVEQEDLPALYLGAQIFVYPSFYEGFGLPVLEAMNVGPPVVCARTTALPEVAGDAAVFCNPQEIRSIAEKIKLLLVSKDKRELYSERGKQRAKDFSWESFIQKFFAIVDNK